MNIGMVLLIFFALMWFLIFLNAFKRIKERKENPEKYDSLPKSDNIDNQRKEIFTSGIVDMRLDGRMQD